MLDPEGLRPRLASLRYVLEPSLQPGVPDTLLGRPVVTDPNVAAFGTGIVSAAFGDWSSAYVIRQAGAIRLERSDDYAFDKDMVTYRAVMRIDGRPLHNNAAVYYKGRRVLMVVGGRELPNPRGHADGTQGHDVRRSPQQRRAGRFWNARLSTRCGSQQVMVVD